MTQYTPTEAGSHLASLKLLEEAADYLRRLPAHPMTNQMLYKIQEHLEEPGAGVRRKRLELITNDEEWNARITSGAAMRGTSQYSPTGAPVIRATIAGHVLWLDSPSVAEIVKVEGMEAAMFHANAIGKEIAEGLEIPLSQITRYEKLPMPSRVSIKLDSE
jgi:anaerobic glycerol-3-phosphate dehydrogenase